MIKTKIDCLTYLVERCHKEKVGTVPPGCDQDVRTLLNVEQTIEQQVDIRMNEYDSSTPSTFLQRQSESRRQVEVILRDQAPHGGETRPPGI